MGFYFGFLLNIGFAGWVFHLLGGSGEGCEEGAGGCGGGFGAPTPQERLSMKENKSICLIKDAADPVGRRIFCRARCMPVVASAVAEMSVDT